MQNNRLTLVGNRQHQALWRTLQRTGRHLELLEHSAERLVLQFASDVDPTNHCRDFPGDGRD